MVATRPMAVQRQLFSVRGARQDHPRTNGDADSRREGRRKGGHQISSGSVPKNGILPLKSSFAAVTESIPWFSNMFNLLWIHSNFERTAASSSFNISLVVVDLLRRREEPPCVRLAEKQSIRDQPGRRPTASPATNGQTHSTWDTSAGRET